MPKEALYSCQRSLFLVYRVVFTDYCKMLTVYIWQQLYLIPDTSWLLKSVIS